MNRVQRTTASIRMGEMSIATGTENLRTLLGSCVGLSLYDRQQQVGGLAHIVLPESRGRQDRPGKFVDTAVPAMIHEMEQIATAPLKLVAKLAGGASMFTSTVASSIGRQNILACEQILREHGIPVLAKHIGGEKGRRMSLDLADGTVLIEIVGEDPIRL